MTVNSATDPTSNSQTGTDNTVPLPTQMLSEQDFLNLLVTQMTSQDPLNPMNNQDMLQQMVGFSTLNANTTMQSTLGTMQTTDQFTQATGLIGRQVTLLTDSSGSTTQGVVTGLDASTGTPQIVVNGTSYDLSQVISVTNATTTQ